MARQIHRLKALSVTRASKPGRYSDGGGLCLQVSGAGAKSWIFRYMRGLTEAGRPREREMGLGSLTAVSLAEARQIAQDARKLLAQGIDPLDAREATRATQRAEQARAMTFEAAAVA